MSVQLLPEQERRRRSLAIQALDDQWLAEQIVKQADEPGVGPGDYNQHALVMEASAADDGNFWRQLDTILGD